MLGDAPLIAFASTADPDASRAFYEDTLGLEFVADESWALVFDAPNAMLRVAKVDEVDASPETILGWEVDDIVESVESIAAGGVELLRYDDLRTSEAPTGPTTFRCGR